MNQHWLRVSLFDARNVIGRIDPFFAKAARGAKITGHLDSTKDGRSDTYVVSSAERANIAGNADDLGELTLRARLRIFHNCPPPAEEVRLLMILRRLLVRVIAVTGHLSGVGYGTGHGAAFRSPNGREPKNEISSRFSHGIRVGSGGR